MATITSIFGLPPYTVEKLADSDGQSRQRERKKEKEAPASLVPENPSGPLATETASTEDLNPAASDSCQQLDSETTVKLLDEQIKTPSSAESRYESVKNLTLDSKVNREI